MKLAPFCFAVVVMAGPAWALGRDEPPEELEALCHRSGKDADGDACYWLSLRYRDGTGVPKDVSRAEALLDKAANSYQSSWRARFCLCLAGKWPCENYGWGPARVADTRRLLAAETHEQRVEVIASSRDTGFLGSIVADQPEEVRTLPQFDELKNAVRLRVRDLPLHDPDPGKRSGLASNGFLSPFVGYAVLDQMARTDPDPEVRKEAARTLGQVEAQLGKSVRPDGPKPLENPDPDVRRMAVTALDDQAALEKIARSDRDPRVRTEAVSRLTNQKLLQEIGRKDKDANVRAMAQAQVKDQAYLEKVARTGRSADERQSAVEEVTNPQVLAWVAENDGEEDVRGAAIARLSDQAALARVARKERNPELRAAAIRKVTDGRVLLDLALTASDEWSYQTAIDQIRDETVLRRILESRWSNAGVVEHISRRATDESTLVLILERSNDQMPLLVAAARLTDPRLAAGVFATHNDATVRRMLVKKITDRALLTKAAETDPNSDVRAEARRRLTELK